MNMKSFSDELTKIAFNPAVKNALERASGNAKLLKWPAIVGGSYLGVNTANQAFKDWKLGRQVRKQYGR